jgi:hypothetical protein
MLFSGLSDTAQHVAALINVFVLQAIIFSVFLKYHAVSNRELPQSDPPYKRFAFLMLFSNSKHQISIFNQISTAHCGMLPCCKSKKQKRYFDNLKELFCIVLELFFHTADLIADL